MKFLKNTLLFVSLVCANVVVFGQDVAFDKLTAVSGNGKEIVWKSSAYGLGFGHRIVNSDPGGKTLLHFQARHNKDVWSNAMVLTSTGRLGIGISDPLEALDVNGGIKGVLRHSKSYFYMFPFNDSYDDGTHARIFYDGNKRTINFWNSGEGNTKIYAGGFTSSSDWFRVNGDNGLFFQSHGGGFRMTDKTWIRTYGGKSFYHDKGTMRTDGRFEVGPAGDRFTVTQNGNVGIGTTNPLHKLHVSHGVQLRKTTIGATIATEENSFIRDDWMTGSYGPAKWNQTAQKWVRPAQSGTAIYNDIGGIIWQDEGTYFIRDYKGDKLEYTNQELLDKSFLFADIITGNVGIGSDLNDTEFRNYKLSVNGKVRATEVKVYTGWADYVFKDDYQLPTLAEVAQHIEEKGHLINIPSEAEVAENGIQLGEMNAKLLEKIEELTLYTLEQQKEIEALKKQNAKINELEQKLNTLLQK